jgi:AraC-like DNA-binding protein
MQTAHPVPLEKFQIVDTRDVDDAREAIGRIFCPHFLVPGGDRTRFHARHHAAPQPGYSVNFVAYGANVEIDPGELSRFFLLQIPLEGSANVRCGTRASGVKAGESASLLSPTLASRMHWNEGCEKLIVLFWREQIEALFEAMTHEKAGAIEFEPEIDLRSAVGQGIAQHAQLLLHAAEQGALLSDTYRVALRDGLATLLLTGLVHSGSRTLQRARADVGPRAIRRAVQFIEAEFSRPIAVTDIATAAGVSLRTLQDGFRKTRGETLWQAVQNVRLDRLRAALQNSTETSVAGAVLSCGLGHLGRAAASYQARFGESPSETLRRART